MWHDFALRSSKSWKSLSREEIRYWSRAVTMEVPSPRFLRTGSYLGRPWDPYPSTSHLNFSRKSSPGRQELWSSWIGKGLEAGSHWVRSAKPARRSEAEPVLSATHTLAPGPGAVAVREPKLRLSRAYLSCGRRAGRGGEPGRGCAASGCARSGSLPNNASGTPSAPGLGALRHRSAL